MAYNSIEFHPGPRVASVVLNRPPLNIITLEMLDELKAALDEADELQVQIVVLSGKDGRGFSAGVEVRDHFADKAASMLARFHDIVLRIRESDFISIAAIHGPTLGGGAELALGCDLVIAADDATIGFPEIDLGCFPPAAAGFLPKAVGLHKAAEMILLGKPISAREAERVGLVNAVVPLSGLTEAADQFIDQLLAKSAPVLALTKRALRAGWDSPLEEAMRFNETQYLEGLTRIQDMEEGLHAFLEKRRPDWKNR